MSKKKQHALRAPPHGKCINLFVGSKIDSENMNVRRVVSPFFPVRGVFFKADVAVPYTGGRNCTNPPAYMHIFASY